MDGAPDGRSSDGRIDVAEVMGAHPREASAASATEGLYTDDEVEELTALKLQAFADEAEIDPELLARLMATDHNWNISTDYRIETHRQGFGARVIVLLKKLVRPLVRLYTDHLLIAGRPRSTSTCATSATTSCASWCACSSSTTALRNRVRARSRPSVAGLRTGGGRSGPPGA